MTDSKVRPEHRRRAAFVYVRQSSPQQVERHRESTLRQYAFVERARELGWPPERIRVIDEDLGRSGASTDGRDGFERLAAEIALRRGGTGARPGGLAPGPQQLRLVPPARLVRPHRHAHRRRRRRLPSSPVQ